MLIWKISFFTLIIQKTDADTYKETYSADNRMKVVFARSFNRRNYGKR